MAFTRHMTLGLLLGVIALIAGTASHFYVKGDDPPTKTAEPSRSPMAIDPQADYQIESVSANKCVKLAGDPSADGGEAQIWTCDKSDAQRFRFESLPDNYYKIRLAEADKCLDVEGISKDDGAAVKGFGCNGGPNQQWIVADAGGGNVRLVARHSGKGLDVWYAGTVDGTPLKQQNWNSGANQQFRLSVATRAAPDAGQATTQQASAGKPFVPSRISDTRKRNSEGTGKRHERSKSSP
jgi:hypothetical protein